MATLTANLHLNTSGFTSGIEKARSATSNYHQEMSRAASAIRGLDGNIKVLQMQASGYEELAASLKRKLDIEAQADKLAKSGLISRNRALHLLNKEQLLLKEIENQKRATAEAEAAAAKKSIENANAKAAADQAAAQRAKALAVDIERARVAAENYNNEMIRANAAIKSVEQRISMLRMEASGHIELAASMRANIDLEDRADKLAKDANITREKAIALLREEQQLERNIATQKANSAAAQAAANQKSALMSNPRAAGLPELPLTDAYLKQTERAAFVAQDARNKFNRLTGAMGNSSMGFLAFSQAVEDAQYGIKGVLNNIPQMILGFGGSMGLAGAISLAAVAAVALYPQIKKLYGSLETERLKAAADAWGEIFNKGIKAATATYEAAKAAVRLETETAIAAQNYRDFYALGQDMGAIFSANVEKLKAERDIHEEIFEARDKLLKLQGKKDDATIEKEKAARELKNIEDQIAERKKQQDADNARQTAAIEGKSNLAQRAGLDRSLFLEELKRLEENLAGAKANLAQADSQLADLQKNDPKNLRDRTTQTQNKGFATKFIERIEAEIAALKERESAIKSGSDEQLKILDAEIKSLDTRRQQSSDDLKRLEALRAQKKELAEINEQTNSAEANAKQDEYNKAYEAEMKVLKARAAGDEKELQRLEYKRQLQEELNELKKAGFVDDGKGTLMKRAKDRVDARIMADEPKKAPDKSGGQVHQLGSVAKATNVLMGRSANDGILAENRRQTSLLRSLDKKIQPTKETTQLPPNLVFA